MLNAILFPILVVGGLGVLFGIILGIAAIKFRVERDPKIDSCLLYTSDAADEL